VVKAYGHRRSRLPRTPALRRRLDRPAVYDNYGRKLLPLLQGVHTRTLNRADMNKYILAAAIWLNEAEAFWLLNHCTVPTLIGARLTRSSLPGNA